MGKLTVKKLPILLTMAGLLLAPSLGWGEVCPERPKQAGPARDEARKWFDEGERLSKEARYEDALDAFLCSQKMLGHENTVFNIAHISKQIEDKKTTLDRLRTFRKENPDIASAGEIDKLISELEAELGEQPEAATVDESLFAEDEPAAEPETETGATPAKLEIDRPMIAYLLFGGAGATLVTSVVLQGLAGATRNKAADTTLWSDFEDKRDKMKGYQTGALVLYIVTAGLAGTGLYLLLTDEGEAQTDDTGDVTVALVPAPTGLALQGSF